MPFSKRPGGLGPQILLEMSGHPDSINRGFLLLRNGGTASVLGIPSAPITLDWAKDVIFKGITIKAINGRRMFDTWFQSQNFMLREQEKINRLITHRLPFDQFQQGFDLLHAGKAGQGWCWRYDNRPEPGFFGLQDWHDEMQSS